MKYILLLIPCLLGIAFCQISPEKLKKIIGEMPSSSSKDVNLFYSSLHYEAVWLPVTKQENMAALLTELEQAAERGLNKNDYQFHYIQSVYKKTASLDNINDSVKAELVITNAAIHYYSHIAYGNTKPLLGYDGLKYIPNCYDIPALLAAFISNKVLSLLAQRVSSSMPEAVNIQQQIKWFVSVMGEKGFKEINITSSKVNAGNKQLIEKLYQLGMMDKKDETISDSSLQQKIKEAQLQFYFAADGVLRSAVLKEFNVPLSVRLRQLNLSLNYYRWLQCLAQHQQGIVVNIPAAYLKVYNNNAVILEMRMIVGKKSTPTPTLSSTVSEVILYPYWHVPYSIATKELLPIIKRNPGYIDAGNYQVLNQNGQIVNPYKVNWWAFSTGYFPYIIRQSTGCDNALGLLKLNFYNPFSVYLHDTPSKSLFKQVRRFYSHGCMRMEKPMEMGHLVLNKNRIAIDTLEAKGCVRNQSPVTVHADVHLPVIVWYNPAGVDSTGRVIFFGDVYDKFDWL